MTTNTFRKEERLCSRKVIGELFLSGSSFLCYPLKVVWKEEELPDTIRAQAVFSVPKRLFKKAHDRNFIKRQLREVYRIRKSELYQVIEGYNLKIALMIVYISKEEVDFGQLESAMDKVIKKFSKKLNPKS